VSFLMTSPLSRGLFHRAIAQSGPSLVMDRSGVAVSDPLPYRKRKNGVRRWPQAGIYPPTLPSRSSGQSRWP
jgi:hypothetical protein